MRNPIPPHHLLRYKQFEVSFTKSATNAISTNSTIVAPEAKSRSISRFMREQGGDQVSVLYADFGRQEWTIKTSFSTE